MIDFWTEGKFLHPIYPTGIVFNSIVFPTVANAIEATKTDDKSVQFRMAKMPPWQAKNLGASLKTSTTWLGMRVELMRYFNMQKFGLIKTPGDNVKRMQNALWLLNTENEELIYWNDNCENFWGQCRCWEHYSDPKPKNAYGKILMEVRRIVGENISKVLDLEKSMCNCGNKGTGRCIYTKAWSILSEVFCATCQNDIEQYCFDESSDGKTDIFYWKSEKNREPIVNRQVLDNHERTVYVPPNIPYVHNHHKPTVIVEEVEVEDRWTPLTLKNGKFL